MGTKNNKKKRDGEEGEKRGKDKEMGNNVWS